MKKAIKILSLLAFILIATISFAQPPPPDEDPNTGGGDELGGGAPIGSGIALLTLLGGAYAMGRTYQLSNNRKK